MTTPTAAMSTTASTTIPAMPAAEMPLLAEELASPLLAEMAAEELEPADVVVDVGVWLSAVAEPVLGALAVVVLPEVVEVCDVVDSDDEDVTWFVNVEPLSELALTVPGALSSDEDVVCELCLVDESVSAEDVVDDFFVALPVDDEVVCFELVELDVLSDVASWELLVFDDVEVGAAVVAVGVAVVVDGAAVVEVGAVVVVDPVEPVELVVPADPLAMARAASISTVCMSAT